MHAAEFGLSNFSAFWRRCRRRQRRLRTLFKSSRRQSERGAEAAAAVTEAAAAQMFLQSKPRMAVFAIKPKSGRGRGSAAL